MKEIGEKLKLAREDIGISKEEVCEDLKIDMEKLNQLEEGDMNAFPDILALKYLIRDYAKYLGLNKDDLVDEFNEFLFDYTSKISLEDIKQAKKEIKKDELNKIQSPYTIERKRKIYNSQIMVYILIFIVLLLLGYFIFSMITSGNSSSSDVITFNM
ncbi:MAG: helix-turn-helix domain-containing protein [Clostridium sp.]|nr:helix-turn-helix domain-containing protein [Clostridium sp.]MCM1444237.1 helix-turn-helix domain-containing protein [Candidatus Amulumruptor caecigallinarius]